MTRDATSPGDYRRGRAEAAIARQLVRLGRHEEALEHFAEARRILSSKGEDSDEVIRLVMSESRSLFALERDLEQVAVNVRDCARKQEALASARKSPSTWREAASTWDLLAEVASMIGREDEVALAEVRAGEARTRATRLDELDTE